MGEGTVGVIGESRNSTCFSINRKNDDVIHTHIHWFSHCAFTRVTMSPDRSQNAVGDEEVVRAHA